MNPRVATVLAVFVSLLAALPLSGFTLKTIVTDGDVAEWDDVLIDPDNAVPDAASFSDPPDPDLPGTADRDIRAVAVTWDADRLFFFLRRTLSGPFRAVRPHGPVSDRQTAHRPPPFFRRRFRVCCLPVFFPAPVLFPVGVAAQTVTGSSSSAARQL